jgi:hypothetical protein
MTWCSRAKCLRATCPALTVAPAGKAGRAAPAHPDAVNLTDRGFQRHRILWVREMDEEELRRVGEAGPTIDRIEVAGFQAQAKLREWLKKVAPAFVRKEG